MDQRDEILATALNLPPGAARTAMIETATKGNPQLRLELLKLLEVHDEAGSFLERAAWEKDDTLVSANQPQEQTVAFEQILERLPRTEGADGLAVLGHFLLLELLGEGGSACVFRARDQRLHRDVAIKILKPALAAVPQQRQRFLAESKTIAGLRGEQIVSIYEVGEYREMPYFVMEYLPEGSLQSFLSNRGPLSFPDTLTVARQILDALEVAHSKGLLHRDIKPSNVLVDRFPDRVKLGDFGLARSLIMEDEDRAIGTPQFSSPEQIRGEVVDERTDLFGFGCLLYSLLVGHSPFSGTSRLQTIQMTLELQPEPFSHFGLEVPEEFQQLINGLLAKSRQDRPSDLKQIARKFEQIVGSPQLPRADRRKWLWAAGGSALAAGVGLLAFWRARSEKPRPLLQIAPEINLKHDDGSLNAFLFNKENATLVTMERLTLAKPMYYWRPSRVGEAGKVIYRFDFSEPLAGCRLKCNTFVALGFDESASSKVRVGAALDDLHDMINVAKDRFEFWPEPGVRSSLPLISTDDSQALFGPKRWVDISSLVRGKTSFFLEAELYASKDILTWSGLSLGPAGAQFLRTNPEFGEVALVLDVRR